MYYVITDDNRLVSDSPLAYTPPQLQLIADHNNIDVYVISGERTGQTASPQSGLDSLRIIAIDGATIWATTEDKAGWRCLYRAEIGKGFQIVGDSMTGIPADAPEDVADEFWSISILIHTRGKTHAGRNCNDHRL